MSRRLRIFYVNPRDPQRLQRLEAEFRGQAALTQRELRRACYDLIPSGCKLERYEVVW